jgi:hypothetical protein
MPGAWAQRVVVAAIATAAFAATAAAQDNRPPPMAPKQDVTVEYSLKRISTEGVAEQAQSKISTAAGGQRIRIEGMMAAGSGTMIFDRANGRTTVMMDAERTYAEMSSSTVLFQWNVDMLESVRKGTDTVAGVNCTVYEMQGNQKTSTVCVTDGGVMLRNEANGPNGQVLMMATSVSYAALADAVFQPPPGYQKAPPSTVPAPKQQP